MLVVPMPSNTVKKKKNGSDEQIKDLIIQDFTGKRINILAPVIRQKGHYAELFQQIAAKGFSSNGDVLDITLGMKLDRYKTHDIEIVVDRMVIEDTAENERLTESINTAMNQVKMY
jgi:excinuclease ABC subunit A